MGLNLDLHNNSFELIENLDFNIKRSMRRQLFSNLRLSEDPILVVYQELCLKIFTCDEGTIFTPCNVSNSRSGFSSSGNSSRRDKIQTC